MADVTRRQLLTMAALAPFSQEAGCADPDRGSDGRLRARPGRPSLSVTPGRQALGLAAGRDGILYVPAGYRPDRPAPLFLAFHGAGNRAVVADPATRIADDFGTVILAPDSRGRTWDAVLGGLGPDVTFVDQALAHTFSRCAIDRARMTVAGFSDGASYALTLGVINGDLFDAIVAFSPGFIGAGSRHGSPRIFVSHGTEDDILPIDRTSRRLVARLKAEGYRVTYKEFAGAHAVPTTIAREAFEWLAR